MPYRFTGKELDEETGLYYYGQRYLDPQYNIWMTSDPAIYDYMSQSKNGEGGICNITNLNLYHYAGNNPVKYTDPDGEEKYNVNLLKKLNINTDFGIGKALQQAQDLSNMLNDNPEYKEQMKAVLQ